MKTLWAKITGSVAVVTGFVWLLLIVATLVRSSLLHQDPTTWITALSTPAALLVPIYAAWRDVKKTQANTADVHDATAAIQQQTNGVLNGKLLVIQTGIQDISQIVAAHLAHHEQALPKTEPPAILNVPPADKWE